MARGAWQHFQATCMQMTKSEHISNKKGENMHIYREKNNNNKKEPYRDA